MIKNTIVQCKIYDDPELGPDTIDVWEGVRKKEGEDADKKFNITDFNILSYTEQKNRVLIRVTLEGKGDAELDIKQNRT